MKKINKKIFPEDFFDLPKNQEELSNAKNKSKQKEHPKLINPSNTIKIVPPVFNEIKEEAFEESIEHLQVKKNNLKIIIPDKSNDELEPSTSGSSNVKLSPNTSSPLICAQKNKFNIYPRNNQIISKLNRHKDKNEDAYKIAAYFANEEKNNISFKENKLLKRPSTPNTNRYKSVYNPPLTSGNKNIDKYKFNYNFDTKKNGVIIPKNENKINKIKRQNLFKIGYNCINPNKNKKNNKNKLNPVTSRIGQIFCSKESSPRESSFVSIKNNLNEKNNSKNNEYNTNNIKNNAKKKSLKKNKNTSFIENQKNIKKNKANSMENKYINKKKYSYKTTELINDINKNDKAKSNNKERQKLHSYNKNHICSYLSDIKFKNVKNQLETELNNMFNNLPEDFENYPELKNYLEIIVRNIHGLKNYIYKNSQNTFKKTNNSINKIKK